MRSDAWKDEFGDLVALIESPETKRLVLSGHIEICPRCNGLSAYAFDDSNAYDEFPDGIPGGFEPQKGTIAHISTCSGWEFECGHCKAHVVEADSPINADCYTHAAD